jgi:hypothetical protein
MGDVQAALQLVVLRDGGPGVSFKRARRSMMGEAESAPDGARIGSDFRQELRTRWKSCADLRN